MEIEKVSKILDNKVALQFSLIGVGNAGNQLLNQAMKYGIDVFAINSSKSDLDDALMSQEIKSFIVGDEARGAGKNREVATNLFKVNGMELFKSVPAFSNMCQKSDVIIVSGSTAGGTGSGVAPIIVKILKKMYPTKIIIFYGILPRLTDFAQSMKNSIDCMKEIVDAEVPYALADLDFYKGLPNDVAYNDVAKHVVDTINCIRGMYINKSAYGMIDENDMRTTISEPGYLSIYNLTQISQQQLDKESLQQMMIRKIKRSPTVDIMRDGIIKQMAAIINMPEEMSDISKSGDYEELVDYIGRPLSVFENYAITNDPHGQMAIILSGQTMPYSRISRMADILKEAADRHAKKKSYDLGSMSSEGDIGSGIPSFLGGKKEDSAVSFDELGDFIDNL